MLRLQLKDFDIEQIAESGQCFRMYRRSDDFWEVHALNEVVLIRKELCGTSSPTYVFDCSEEKFKNFWENYFDLQTDYGKIKNRIFESGDQYLMNAVKFGGGIRILRQDVWETIVSFVISQQNNIPRIAKCLKNLCEINEGKFPTPYNFSNFSEEQINSVKLGYRKNYLLKISKIISNGIFDLKNLQNMSYENSVKHLKNLPGIGEKVANCIALFGLHKIEAFPTDVWIKKIIRNNYNGNFSLGNLRDIGGVVQQYMFFYERKTFATKSQAS